MKKFATTMLLLLNVTNLAFADCVTGYACSIKDLNKNDTNSVIQNKHPNDTHDNEISKEKIQAEQEKIKEQIDEKIESEKEIQVEE